MRAITTALLVNFAVSAAAAAACEGSIKNVELARSFAYDPFAAVDRRIEEAITVESRTNGCSFLLAFARTPAFPSKLGGSIEYDLTDSGGARLLVDTPASARPSAFLATGTLDAGAQRRVDYEVSVRRGQMVAAGGYSDRIELRLYDAQTNALLDTKSLGLTIEVAAMLGINLAGVGVTSKYNYTMDFGDLQTGEVGSVNVEIRSNQRFKLEVASQHLGVMRLDPPNTNWTIGYTATLDGVELRFPGQTRGYDPTTASGKTLPFRVAIGDVARKRAGTYRDEITLTVSPSP